MSVSATQAALGALAVDLIRAMLDAGHISTATHPVYAPALRKLLADYDSAATVVHIRRPDSRWPKDDVPACDGPGNKPTDLYSNDKRRVTCAACLRALEEEQ